MDPDDSRNIFKHPDHWYAISDNAIASIDRRTSAVDAAGAIYRRHGVMRQTLAISMWLRSHWIRGHDGKRGGEMLLANTALHGSMKRITNCF